MYVLCEYTERAILQMLSENKQREGILKSFDDYQISKVPSRSQL